MKLFTFPVLWFGKGMAEVQAETLEEAIGKAEDPFSVDIVMHIHSEEFFACAGKVEIHEVARNTDDTDSATL